MMPEVEQSEVQGNVLYAYGTSFGHARYVRLRIGGQRAALKRLAEWREKVTFGRVPDKVGAASHVNVAFTWRGLRALGVPRDLLYTFPPDFRWGAEARAYALGDHWQRTGGFQEAHVLLVIHGKDPGVCDQVVRDLLPPGGQPLILVDDLRAARYDKGDGVTREYFGFADGRSQPAIDGVDADPVGDGTYACLGPRGGPVRRQLALLAEDVGLRPIARTWRGIRAGEFLLGYENEDGILPQGPPAPLGPNGTFMVYREIDQDVAGFDRYIKAAAKRLDMSEPELKAKIIGRWEDGSPLAVSGYLEPALAMNRRRSNDFVYSDDREGYGCPLGAHVRRTNPRDALPGGAERSMRHRIIRRGMPYARPAPGRRPATTKGLAFICYSASIEAGFEFIQREWINRGDAFGLGPDPDFLLQQPDRNGKLKGKMVIQGYRSAVLQPPRRPFVTVRGCDYLFLPSRRAYEWLAHLGT